MASFSSCQRSSGSGSDERAGPGRLTLTDALARFLEDNGSTVLCDRQVSRLVIDDGRSFEHSAKLQGGAFVEFTMSSGFCLNPFSMIDEELAFGLWKVSFSAEPFGASAAFRVKAYFAPPATDFWSLTM